MIFRGKSAIWFLIIMTVLGIFSGEWDIVVGMWIMSGILTFFNIILS